MTSTSDEPHQTGPPLGLGELGAGEYIPQTFAFEPGDILLLYTDGVVEARDGSGAFYPLAERLPAWAGQDPEALVRLLHDDLLGHVGGTLNDDAAAIVVQRLPTGPLGCVPGPAGSPSAVTLSDAGPAGWRPRRSGRG